MTDEKKQAKNQAAAKEKELLKRGYLEHE